MLLIGALDAGSTPSAAPGPGCELRALVSGSRPDRSETINEAQFSAYGEVASRKFGELEIAGPIPARLTNEIMVEVTEHQVGGAAVRM